MTDAEFLAWRKSADAQFALLVEVDVTILGVDTTLYLSTHAYQTTALDTPANQHYQAVLSKDLAVDRRLSLDGRPVFSIGEQEIDNTDGSRNAWLRYVWAGRANRVYLGDVRWPRSEFQLQHSGITANIAPKGRTKLSLKLRDKMQRLNMAMSEIKVGGTVTTNPDALRPHTLGEVHNVTPVMTGTSTWQFHNGPSEAAKEVRDEGLPLVAGTEYTVDLTNGKFTLLQAPDGAITCSVQGAAGVLVLDYPSASRWRVNITASGSSGCYVQDFEFREVAGVQQNFAGGTATTNGTAGIAAHGADNSSGTFWYSIAQPSVGAPIWWEYNFATSKAIKEYTLRSHSTSPTRPSAWTLEYWNGSSWVVMDTRSGVTWASVEETKVFSVSPAEVTTPGSYLNRVGTLVPYVVKNFGKESERFTDDDLDLVQLAAFDAAHQQPVGLWIPDRMNVIEACEKLASSLGAQTTMSRTGKLRLIKVDAPGTSTRDIYEHQMVAHSFTPLQLTEVVGAVKLGFNRNYTLQPGLETSLSALDKEYFNTEWLTATKTDSFAIEAYRLSTEPVQQDTLLLRSIDAEPEAQRRLNFSKVPRVMYQFICYAEMFDLELGDSVTIFHKDLGPGGFPALVMRCNPTYARNRITVEVLI